MKIILTIIITLFLLLLTVFVAGGGHGNYILAKLIYPFTMLLAEFKNEINIVGIALAIVQIPIYALILHKKPNWKYYILGIHCFAAILGLTINNGSF